MRNPSINLKGAVAVDAAARRFFVNIKGAHLEKY
jgi:hypothetical protein